MQAFRFKKNDSTIINSFYHVISIKLQVIFIVAVSMQHGVRGGFQLAENKWGGKP